MSSSTVFASAATAASSHRTPSAGWKRVVVRTLIHGAGAWLALTLVGLPSPGAELTFHDVLGPRLGAVPLVAVLWLCALWFLIGGVARALLDDGDSGLAHTDRTLWLALVAALLQVCALLACEPALRALTGGWSWGGSGAYFGAPHLASLWLGGAVFVSETGSGQVVSRLFAGRGYDHRQAASLIPVLGFVLLGATFVAIGDPPETRLISAFAMGIPGLVALSRIVRIRTAATRSVGMDFPVRDTAPLRTGRVPTAILFLVAAAAGIYLSLLLRTSMVDSDVPFLWITPAVCALTLAHGCVTFGWRRALTFFAITCVVASSAEIAGTAGGWVFGEYHYTDVFPDKILGQVPALIPLAWFLMLYPCHVIANLIGHGRLDVPWGGWPRALWLAGLSSLLMTGWDVAVDPHVVHKTGAWVWANPGAHYGVPLSNYVGWLFTSFSICLAYRVTEKYLRRRPLMRQPLGFAALPLASFCLMILGHLVYGFPESTLLVPLAILGLPLALATRAVVLRLRRPVRLPPGSGHRPGPSAVTSKSCWSSPQSFTSRTSKE